MSGAMPRSGRVEIRARVSGELLAAAPIEIDRGTLRARLPALPAGVEADVVRWLEWADGETTEERDELRSAPDEPWLWIAQIG